MASNSDPYITKKEAFLSFVRASIYGLVIPDTAWHEVDSGGREPAFEDTWENYGGAFEVARYRKDALGWVHIQGHVKSGASLTVVFTLPAGYRPRAELQFYQRANLGACVARIGADGTVVVQIFTGGDNAFVAINLPSFYAEG